MSRYYDEILKICERYFSTEAQRFLDRQIAAHLNKAADAITPADRSELARWCKISGSLLLGEDKAEQLSNDILSA
jgi:hypothetical protein